MPLFLEGISQDVSSCFPVHMLVSGKIANCRIVRVRLQTTHSCPGFCSGFLLVSAFEPRDDLSGHPSRVLSLGQVSGAHLGASGFHERGAEPGHGPTACLRPVAAEPAAHACLRAASSVSGSHCRPTRVFLSGSYLLLTPGSRSVSKAVISAFLTLSVSLCSMFILTASF